MYAQTIATLRAFAAVTVLASTALAQGGRLDAETLKGLEFRFLGPGFVTGRVVDIEIDPKNPNVWHRNRVRRSVEDRESGGHVQADLR